MSELSSEQKNILACMRDGNNLLITGPAGTGKSFLLDHIRDMLKLSGTRYAVTASTGAAAANIGGTTLHSWAGIGLGSGTLTKILEGVRMNRPAFKRIRSCQVLVIDEISMIPADLLDTLNDVFRAIRGVDMVFGGTQMVFIGDFAQLRPVKGEFAFKSKSWNEANVISMHLTKIFRQDDALFTRALNQMRMGALDAESKKLILSRYQVIDDNPGIIPVSIVSTNAEAARINDAQLAKLPADAKVYFAEDSGTPSGLKMLEKSTIPKELVLKVGARVICLQNFPKLELVNGSAGTVVEVNPYLEVRFDKIGSIMMPNHTREIMQGDVIIAKRKQYPLKLGWALTSHSVQGMSLDKIAVHMGGAFEPAQTYVAMSRVRTLGGLFIRSINKNNVTCHKDARDFYADNSGDFD